MVHIDEKKKKKKSPLGSGERFASLTEALANKSGASVSNPKALAASIGRKKYGAAKFNKLAAKGRKKAAY